MSHDTVYNSLLNMRKLFTRSQHAIEILQAAIPNTDNNEFFIKNTLIRNELLTRDASPE